MSRSTSHTPETVASQAGEMLAGLVQAVGSVPGVFAGLVRRSRLRRSMANTQPVAAPHQATLYIVGGILAVWAGSLFVLVCM